MSPRTGRPKSTAPKRNDVKVRLDDAVHTALLTYCKEHSMTKAEAIRLAIVQLLDKK